MIHSAGNSTHHKYRVYISWVKQVSNIGLMPLLPENSHAAALTQPRREFGQGSCGTSESKLDSCADTPAAPRSSKRDTVAEA